jgi:adenylyltransferase/sulfurtransferase
MSFSRYARHLVIPEVGASGQERLRRSSAVVVGAGGLGSPALQYLAASGVGTIGIVDDDVVSESNLQRQVIHRTDQVGRPKVETAAEFIRGLNPDVKVQGHRTRLTSGNALDLLGPYDVILDGSDNFATRYLVNDVGALLRKPVVYGSVYRFEGQVAVFDARRGPCYRCLYATPPPSDMAPDCGDAGVLGVLPGLVGTIQAAETLKLLLGVGAPLIGRMLLVDALAMELREVRFGKDPACPLCGPSPSITTLIDYNAFCATSRRGDVDDMIREMTVEELKDRMDRRTTPAILDVRELEEHEFVNIGGTVIPVRELPERWKELDPAKEWVVYCRSGVRSANAVRFLQQHGFTNVRNLRGGILEWARTIDPSKPTY